MGTITITEELLDTMVNAITQLPWRDAAPILEQLGQELSQTQSAPSIITEK